MCEVEEETGWRPRTMRHLVTYQPAIGTLDHPPDIYLAHGADLTDTRPDINEAEMIRWVPLDEAMRMIDPGEIVGAATVVGVYRALLEDRGLVADRTPESADLRSPNSSTPPTRSRADPAAPSDQQPCGARQASCA
ncbi:NUDIX hydrolase [Nocardia fusca]|uniref:NUDIX domain-containing protein n=1 Tax=Nocardia fusca TaxID=941183 RepID=A0ABV3F5V8_9NOCA